MINLRTFIISFLMSFCIIASAEKSEKIIIYNGYFFNELSAALKNSKTPKDMKLFIIATPEGANAIGMYAPSVELSDESLQYAVPVENVIEGAELLRRYNEQKENSKNISFTMSAKKPLIKTGDVFPEFLSNRHKRQNVDQYRCCRQDHGTQSMVYRLRTLPL